MRRGDKSTPDGSVLDRLVILSRLTGDRPPDDAVRLPLTGVRVRIDGEDRSEPVPFLVVRSRYFPSASALVAEAERMRRRVGESDG